MQVYYHIAENSGDVSGVQSLVAAIFMTSAFGGNINLNVIVPAHLGQRSVFYREVSSFYFDPLSLSIANFVVELPWLFGIILSTMSIVYFMIGLSSDPNTFFFHLFVSYVLAVVYVSIGMFLAAAMPTFEVAQAFLGVIAPLFFLFGGLFSPISAMAPGARWFCYVSILKYMLVMYCASFLGGIAPACICLARKRVSCRSFARSIARARCPQLSLLLYAAPAHIITTCSSPVIFITTQQ